MSRREEFNFFKPKEENKIQLYIEDLINKNNITIINFDKIDDEIIEVVSAVLSRIFFEYLKKQEDRNKKLYTLF